MVQQSPTELQEVIAAERTGYPFLVWRTDADEQRLLLLDQANWRVTIGRDAGADVPLPWDAEVSRTHALVEQVGRGWMLVDDGLSRNGSFVNGARVVGRRRLADKDRLVVGATQITYRETSGSATQTASAIDTPAAFTLTPMQRKVLIALCRPVQESASATPATNRQISEEVFLTVDAVKAHLRVLFDRYGLSQLPQNEKRARLVTTVLEAGVLVPRDFYFLVPLRSTSMGPVPQGIRALRARTPESLRASEWKRRAAEGGCGRPRGRFAGPATCMTRQLVPAREAVASHACPTCLTRHGRPGSRQMARHACSGTRGSRTANRHTPFRCPPSRTRPAAATAAGNSEPRPPGTDARRNGPTDAERSEAQNAPHTTPV